MCQSSICNQMKKVLPSDYYEENEKVSSWIHGNTNCLDIKVFKELQSTPQCNLFTQGFLNLSTIDIDK